jgi:RNA polymerase primary sigma factor
MQRIAILRGFARIDDCEKLTEAGEVPVLDEAGEQAGWLQIDQDDAESGQVVDLGEAVTDREERSQLLVALVAAERALLCACIDHGEFAALRDAVEECTEGEEAETAIKAPLDEQAAHVQVGALNRRDCASATRQLVVELSCRATLAPQLREAVDRLLAIREKLFRTNFRLVVSIAKAQSGALDWNLALLAGSDGLNDSLDRFEPERGLQFSTFAHWWIRQRVSRARQDHSMVLRLPVHAQEHLGRVASVERATWQTDGPRPPLELTAANAEASAVRVAEWRRVAITAHVGLTGGIEALGDTIVDPLIPCPADGGLRSGYIPYLEARVRDLCERSLYRKNALPPDRAQRAKEIILLRLGIGAEEQTLAEIGDRVGITRERVRQIQDGLLKKAARLLRLSGGDSLSEFWDWELDNE